MNVIEFVIKMKNDASLTMNKVTKDNNAAAASFTKITASNKQFQAVIGSSAHSVDNLSHKIEALQASKEILPAGSEKQIQEVNEEIDKLSDKLQNIDKTKPEGAKGYFASLLDSIPPILKNPVALIGGGIVASLNEGMKNSKTKLQLGNLLGKESGEELYKSLRGVKAMIGDETFEFGKAILNSGVAVDSVVGRLNSLGEVANGNKEKLAGLVDTFTEMKVEGKFTEEGFKKLTLAGFNPLDQISKQTGESMSKLTKRMQEGKIEVSEVEKALDKATAAGGDFYGNMAAINNSPEGKWNLMIAKISEFGARLGEFLMPIVSKVMDFAAKAFGWLSDKIEATVKWLQPLFAWVEKNKEVLGLLASVIAGVVVGIYAVTAAKAAWIAITGGLTTAIEVMSTAIMNIPVIGWILAAIAAIIAAIIYLKSHFTGFGKFFTNLWEIAKASWTLFVSGMKMGFEAIAYGVQSIWLRLKSFGQYVAELFSNIGESLKLAAEFKFDEAKAKLTATITTEASKEIKQLDKDHFAKQKNFMDEQLKAAKTILSTPLTGLIKSKEDQDPNAATNSAFGDKTKGAFDNKQKNEAKANDGLNAISGGGVKNIHVTVGKMIETSNVYVTKDTEQDGLDLERKIEEGLVRVIASASSR